MRATVRRSEMAALGALFRYIECAIGMGFRAAKLYHGRTKTPIIRLGRSSIRSPDIAALQPSRIMKENYGLDPKGLFLCIRYRHK